METATILFFSATASFLFLCVGLVVGWVGKQFMHYYFYSKEEMQAMHPEMYDGDGMIINEELLSVRFIEEEPDETFDA
jgi:hypothetical protein